MTKQKKKHQYKQHDLVDYAKVGFNPFVLAAETITNLENADYDPAFGPHRARMKKWQEREKERAALAKKLGVTQTVKLTPASEVLNRVTPDAVSDILQK